MEQKNKSVWDEGMEYCSQYYLEHREDKPRFKTGDKVYFVRKYFLMIVEIECEAKNDYPIVYWLKNAPVTYAEEKELFATFDCAVKALEVIHKSSNEKGYLCVPYYQLEKELDEIRQKDKMFE